MLFLWWSGLNFTLLFFQLVLQLQYVCSNSVLLSFYLLNLRLLLLLPLQLNQILVIYLFHYSVALFYGLRCYIHAMHSFEKFLLARLQSVGRALEAWGELWELLRFEVEGNLVIEVLFLKGTVLFIKFSGLFDLNFEFFEFVGELILLGFDFLVFLLGLDFEILLDPA